MFMIWWVKEDVVGKNCEESEQFWTNDWTAGLGFGVYHSGISVYGRGEGL